MKKNNLEIIQKIQIAKQKQKLGKFDEAEKIYQELLFINNDSFDLNFSYALFCKDLKKFLLAFWILFSFDDLLS